MIRKCEYMQKFRDAEANGKIGVRGYLSAFMDEAAVFMYEKNKGNNVLPEKYGCAWIFTKYRMRIHKMDDFSGPVLAESWIGKQTKAKIRHEIIISRSGDLLAEGLMEEAVLNFRKQMPERLSTVEFPEDLAVDRHISLDKFTIIKTDTSAMEYTHSHKIRYTDIDKSRHFFNLRYVDLIEDAFSMEEYDRKMISEIEIHFLAQGRYGEHVNVYRAPEPETGGFIISIATDEGTELVKARVIFSKEK